MRQKIQSKIDNNEGIYRRGNSGLSTVFYIDSTVAEPGTEVVATSQQVESKLKGGYVAYDNLMNGVFNDGMIEVNSDTGERARLVSINDADIAIRNINEGVAPPYNETIDFIVKNQPIDPKTGTRKYTERDIWNEYFKGVGINTQIPPNAVDFSTYKVETSSINANTDKLSDKNKATVGLYCQLADEGLYVTGEPSAEATRINEEKQTRFSVLDILNRSGLIDTSNYRK